MTYNLPAIRIKCAELVGWTFAMDRYVKECMLKGDRMDWSQTFWWNPRFPAQYVPDFPCSADAANQLVEWMKENKGACCRMSNAGWVWWIEFTCEQRFEAEAEPLPLAICLAFLRANGVNPETL